MAESLAHTISSRHLDSGVVSCNYHAIANRRIKLVPPNVTGLQRLGSTHLWISKPVPTPLSTDKGFVAPSAITTTERETSKRDDQWLLGRLRNISFAAEDRSEMHAMISIQRDNWNKLCHTTVTMTTIAAAMLASMNGGEAISMSLAAFLLNGGTAGFVLFMNKFQPSQLAEDQRTAARFFKMLAKDIKATLRIEPRLREDAQLYLEAKVARLQALHKAFPLPLTPDGLEKFPQTVKPCPEVDLTKPEIPPNHSNAWTECVSDDLRHTVEKAKKSDIEEYIGRAKKRERDNKRFAIAAPSLTATAALFCILHCIPGLHMSCIAAACSILAMFANTFSQARQIGIEMYRICAGPCYADMDCSSTQRTHRLPVDQREDGAIFHHKIASLQLGRRDRIPLVGVEDSGEICYS